MQLDSVYSNALHRPDRTTRVHTIRQPVTLHGSEDPPRLRLILQPNLDGITRI